MGSYKRINEEVYLLLETEVLSDVIIYKYKIANHIATLKDSYGEVKAFMFDIDNNTITITKNAFKERSKLVNGMRVFKANSKEYFFNRINAGKYHIIFDDPQIYCTKEGIENG